MREARHIFAQTAGVDGVEQVARIEGQEPSRHWLMHAPWSRVVATPIERSKRVAGTALRWAARGVYLCPVLLLLRLGPREVGDAGVVVLVSLAVLFFTLLNTFVFVSLLAYRKQKRHPPTPELRLPFSTSGGDALALLGKGALSSGTISPGQTLRVRGTVVGLHGVPRGGSVIDDWWWPKEAVRATEAADLLIDRGSEPCIVLRFEAAPLLIARPETIAPGAMTVSQAATELLPVPLPQTPCERVRLCDGDEVELVGTVLRLMDDVQAGAPLADAARPYRAGASRLGILVDSSYDRPICLRVTRPRFA